jgi:ribosomal protein S18 acetylase RimI-like enzyme
MELATRIQPRVAATRLRPAGASDATFLKELFASVRAGDFAATGLPPDMLERLLEQQFRAQTAGYEAQFPDASSLIVMHGDEQAGRLLLQASGQCWRIVDIALLKEMRGRGIGTDLIEAVARAAHQAGARQLALSVLASNAGARRLYARLGFTETGSGVHVAMTKQLVG